MIGSNHTVIGGPYVKLNINHTQNKIANLIRKPFKKMIRSIIVLKNAYSFKLSHNFSYGTDKSVIHTSYSILILPGIYNVQCCL